MIRCGSEYPVDFSDGRVTVGAKSFRVLAGPLLSAFPRGNFIFTRGLSVYTVEATKMRCAALAVKGKALLFEYPTKRFRGGQHGSKDLILYLSM